MDELIIVLVMFICFFVGLNIYQMVKHGNNKLFSKKYIIISGISLLLLLFVIFSAFLFDIDRKTIIILCIGGILLDILGWKSR